MNRILKEELSRSIAVFFFALIGMSFAVTNINIPANFCSVLGIPMLITITIFLFLVYYRNKSY
jgi:hypothetical protein